MKTFDSTAHLHARRKLFARESVLAATGQRCRENRPKRALKDSFTRCAESWTAKAYGRRFAGCFHKGSGIWCTTTRNLSTEENLRWGDLLSKSYCGDGETTVPLVKAFSARLLEVSNSGNFLGVWRPDATQAVPKWSIFYLFTKFNDI